MTDQPGHCRRACADGCETCTEDGACLFCTIGYEMTSPGMCEECAISELGEVMCGARGPRQPIGACSCKDHEWFDGQFCRECDSTCSQCSPSHNNPSISTCITCMPTYLFATKSSICVPACGTGFKPDTEDVSKCTGVPGKVAEFVFGHLA
jgi:hypothetical protein